MIKINVLRIASLLLTVLFGVGVNAAEFIKQAPSAGSQVRKFSASQTESLDRFKKLPEVSRVTAVGLELSALRGPFLTVSIPGGPALELQRKSLDAYGNSTWSLVGDPQQEDAALFFTDGKTVSGSIRAKGKYYQFRDFGEDDHLIIESNPKVRFNPHPAQFPKGAAEDRSSLDQGSPQFPRAQPQVTPYASGARPNIRVLVAYTLAAASRLGNMTSYGNFIVGSMNVAFNGSSVGAELAGTFAVGWNEVGMADTMAMTKNDKLLLLARDNLNADVVILFANFSADCGLANAIHATPQTAFAVVNSHPTCEYRYTATHELGHLLGFRHNIENDTAMAPFAQGHGFRAQFKYNSYEGLWTECHLTMMSYAYPSGCTEEKIYNMWSSPSKLFWRNWAPISQPAGNSTQADQWAVLTVTGPPVTTFRNTKLAGGALGTIGAAISMIFSILYD